MFYVRLIKTRWKKKNPVWAMHVQFEVQVWVVTLA